MRSTGVAGSSRASRLAHRSVHADPFRGSEDREGPICPPQGATDTFALLNLAATPAPNLAVATHHRSSGRPVELLKSHNPATGDLVGEVPITPVDQIPDIVARVRSAQSGWEALGARGRAHVLMQAADIFAERAEKHGLLITAEMVEALEPEVVEDGRLRSTVYRDPLGVSGAITPWNCPMSMPSWMVLPALMAGNTVVFKPSEEIPLSGQAYADVLNEVLPEDVLLVVHGADPQGRALVRVASAMKVGNGEEDPDEGPMVNARQGDLRPGGVRDPGVVRGRSRGAGQRHPLRPGSRGLRR